MSRGELGPDLERLPGVLAATVFDDASRGPQIYLATTPRAHAETLRTATLALLEDRGLQADPDRIHIAASPAKALATSPLPHFTLDSLEIHRSDMRAECSVRLRTGDRLTPGSAREPDTVTGRARAAARAVLAAVESLDPDLRLGLHGIRPLDLVGHEAVVVLLEGTAGRAHAHLPGAALVERSVEEAVARATLMALRGWTP